MKFTLILVVVPSRIGTKNYFLLKRQIDEMVGYINGKYGSIDWIPVWYLYRRFPLMNLTALYNVADIALVTPLRDGMNLIAKEYMATKTDRKGVLILSEMAGAAKEMGEAIIVNPNNFERIADSIKLALTMPVEEQIKRNRELQKRLRHYSVSQWSERFIQELVAFKKHQTEVFVRKLAPDIQEILVDDYRKSINRLVLLDYDGTLQPFESRPELAKPDESLLALLKKMCRNPRNDVLIISGRDKETLETWFDGISIGLIAEHGVWMKEHGGTWEMIEHLRNDWKDEIRPLLEIYMDRTPGSLIEEKEFSLVWHYRSADPALASIRALELKDALIHLTTNLGLGVLEGSKIIEVKNLEINKGLAALRWISNEQYDFILAMGDDWTDEDVFNALGERAYSIRIGYGYTKARFMLDSYEEARELLNKMAGGIHDES